MAKTIYCWRCKTDIPMLDEQEWEQLSPLLNNPIGQIKAYRAEHQTTLADARENWGEAARAKYFAMTGHCERYADNIFHHRLNMYGPLCHACGKPFRTPRAKLCAACGAARKD